MDGMARYYAEPGCDKIFPFFWRSKVQTCTFLLAKQGADLYLAGAEGIEPSMAVLETAVIPFNYAPKTL